MRTIIGIFVAVTLGAASGCKRNVVIKSSLAPGAPAQAATDVSALQDALRRAASAQEIYYATPENRYTYASDASRLRYRPPEGMTLTISGASATGWAGMSRFGTSGPACVVFVGEVSNVPVTPGGVKATANGVVACDRT